jgi:hypothetical protein
VPVPLTADLWSTAIFKRTVTPRELVTAIIADRSAALICLGLSALDDRTLAFFADHPSLLERIYLKSSTAFGAFSSSLQVDGNRVVPPGGPRAADPAAARAPLPPPQGPPQAEHDDAVALWEGVLAEKVTRPERFITQLLELNEGRLAFLYDTIGQLDPPRRAFALGLWMNPAARAERFKALVSGVDAYREAHLKTLPYGRASYDLSMTLTRIEVDGDGAPRQPSSRGLWSRVFNGPDLPDDGARQMRGVEEDPIDAAWLVGAIGTADVRLRSERLDQIAFGQRVFASVDANERGDVLVALRALARYRMLVWTLERMGVTAPAVYAAAARHAVRIGTIEGRRGFDAQAQFQGVLALLARMTAVRTLNAKAAQKLLEQLVALPLNESGEYAGTMARWLHDV